MIWSNNFWEKIVISLNTQSCFDIRISEASFYENAQQLFNLVYYYYYYLSYLGLYQLGERFERECCSRRMIPIGNIFF